jgi:hypothetical protein
MDCVNQILEFYNRNVKTEEFNPDGMNKVWLSKLLIKLMISFEEKQMDKLNLKNCLILLVNLYSNFYGPDHYCTRGKNAQELPKEEKESYKDLLFGEFINN